MEIRTVAEEGWYREKRKRKKAVRLLKELDLRTGWWIPKFGWDMMTLRVLSG